MNDGIIYFEQKVLSNNIDTSEFADVMLALQECDYQRVNLKPLKGQKGFYRAITDYQGRIILTTLERDGKNYLVVVEHIKDHKYDRSKSLNATKVLDPRDFEDQLKDSDSDDSDDELTDEDKQLFQSIFSDIKTPTFTYKKAFCVKHTYISLSECQSAVKLLPAPIVVNGLPGSGKTVMLYEVLLDFVIQNPRIEISNAATSSTTQQPEQAVGFYVAASAPFVASVKKDWQESASVPINEDRIRFMSYRDFAVLQDPELAKKQQVGLREFIIWAKNKELGKLSARTIYKDLRFASICQTFNDYRKVGVRNLHYHQANEMQSIWNLYQDYKKHLGNTLVDFAFAEFNIVYLCDILCVDETQDLSLIQIIQLIRSSKKQQYYLAMDINQSLFLDVSIRPLLLQLLTQHNFNTAPVNVFLRANHRMPQSSAKIATLLLLIKNHLMGGTVDKQEGFALEDIQGTDKPGQVVLLYKPNPEDKKPEIRLTDQETLSEQTAFLRKIARQTDTAFIVPNEVVRERVIREYGATQVFLTDEAKGLQWANVGAIDIIGMSDALQLFQQANQDLPKNAADLRKNPNRPKNKDDNSQTEYNSAFASPLVAISRCTETLYIVETYSRKIARVLDLLQQSVTPSALPSKPREELVTTKTMWVEQIKQLIANGNMFQAILAARQELSLTVDDAVTDEELLQLISAVEVPVTNSIGLEVKPIEKPYKSKNAKKKQSYSSSSSISIATPASSAKPDKLFLDLLVKFLAPKTMGKLFFELEQPIFAKVDLLSLINSEKIQKKIISSNDTGVQLIDFLFKRINYDCDIDDVLTDFLVDDKEHYSKYLHWLLTLESGCKLFFDLSIKISGFEPPLLIPLSRIMNGQRSLAKLAFHQSDLLHWFVASKMDKDVVQLASKIINRRFDESIKMAEDLLSVSLDTRQELFVLCDKVMRNDCLFTRVFFISIQVSETQYSVPLFLKFACDDRLMTWFLEFLDSNIELKAKFDRAFGHECLVTRFIDNKAKKNPFERLCLWQGFQYQELSPVGRKFIISYLANPECVLAYDNKNLNPFTAPNLMTDPMLNSFMWLTVHLVKNQQSTFLMMLACQDPDLIINYLAFDFKGLNLKSELRRLLGESYFPDWNSIPDELGMLDLLLLSFKGIDFLYDLSHRASEQLQKRIINKVQQSIAPEITQSKESLLYRLITYENGLLLLRWLQNSKEAFADFLKLVNEQIASNRFDAEMIRTYDSWVKLCLRALPEDDLISESHSILKFNPFRDRDSRIENLKDFSKKQLKVNFSSTLNQRAKTEPLYDYFFSQSATSIYMRLSDKTPQELNNFLMLILSQVRRFAGLNLPMSMLIGTPYLNSRYFVFSRSNLGRQLLEVLLRIRTFDISSITVEQLIYSIQFMPTTPGTVELSLLYILAVTAGEEGKNHLLKLADSCQQIYRLIQKKDLLIQSANTNYNNENLDEFDIPLVQLAISTAGSKFIQNYNYYAKQNNLVHNIFTIEDLNLVERYRQKINQRVIHAAGTNMLSKSINPSEITTIALQSYIQGNAFQGSQLIRKLCENPQLLALFSQILDSPLLSKSPVTLKMLFEEKAITLLRAHEKLGVSVLAKLFKNGAYFNNAPELLQFFEYSENSITNLHWLMLTTDGVKLLYDAIEFSSTILEYCLKKLDFLTVASVRNATSIDAKTNEYVLTQLGKKLSNQTIVNTVIVQSIRQVVQLQTMYYKKMVAWNVILNTPNADHGGVVSEFTSMIKSIFVSREFARIFFMANATSTQTGAFGTTGSLFAQILSHTTYVDALMKLFIVSPNCKEIFETYFSLNCLSQKAFIPENIENSLVIKTKVFPMCPVICTIGKVFLLHYLANHNKGFLVPIRELASLITMSNQLPAISDPIVWMTIQEVINPSSEFIHQLRAVHPKLMSLYLKKEFPGKDLQSIMEEDEAVGNGIKRILINDIRVEMFAHVHDMIDLLSLSKSGVFFLANYLDHAKESTFVAKLIEKCMHNLNAIRENKTPYFLERILSKEGGAMIISRLAKNYLSQLAPMISTIESVRNLKLSKDHSDLLNVMAAQFPKFARIMDVRHIHLYGGKMADYHYYYVDSRVEAMKDLASRYWDVAKRESKRLYRTELNNSVEDFMEFDQSVNTLFGFVHIMFYSDLIEPFSLVTANRDTLAKFMIALYKNPQYIVCKNIPMFKLISTPYENSTYCKLVASDLGRHLIGYLLQFRMFSLDSITVEQLLHSILVCHREKSASISLFFALTVTAGEKGHEKLFKLLDTPAVAEVLEESDLLMQDSAYVFAKDENATPYASLKTTPTGLLAYQKILSYNPKLFNHPQKPSDDDDDNANVKSVGFNRN